jgi:hypothetical protein
MLMTRLPSLLMSLAACLLLAACNSGPSSSGSASSNRDAAAVLERKAEHIEGLMAQRSAASGVLNDLMSALPDRAWLTDVTYSPGKVQFKGRAPSNNLLADYLSRLGERPSLTNITLRTSSIKIVRGRESQEFTVEAEVADAGSPSAPAGVPLAARVEELEKALPSRQDTAGTLREIQRLARDSGLQMTKFAPGAEVPGEFTSALPVTIEVSGERSELGRYLRSLAGSASLWVVDRFSFKAVSADDARAPVRASITAKMYLLR